MTEPTAEQIEAERERARQAIIDWGCVPLSPNVIRLLATALARVRVEGHAAGRDEAEKLLRARADVAYVITDLGAVRERKALHFAADAIARRGKEGA